MTSFNPSNDSQREHRPTELPCFAGSPCYSSAHLNLTTDQQALEEFRDSLLEPVLTLLPTVAAVHWHAFTWLTCEHL